ncbi:MAG: MFS transporter [Deltaproteobacteria bacterium]|nr:MFS transporter [Deltaproteobacteria bacterium]
MERKKLILWVAVTGNLFGNMGFTGITVAMPAIERDLGLSAPDLGWIMLSCMLAMAAFSAPVARLADIWGRRGVTLAGFLVAMGGSIGSALSRDFAFFALTRAVTGLGLIAFFTTTMAMVTAAYPKEERGKVLGLTIGAVYVALSLGPLVGGFLVERWGWEAIFWFCALNLVPSTVLILLVKGEEPVSGGESFDVGGMVLWALAVSLGFAGFSSLGRDFAWPGLASGIVFMTLFVLKTRKSKYPLLDFGLFSNSKRFAFSCLAAYVSYLASFSVSTLLSLYFQYSKGLSPAATGFVLVAQPLFQAMITPVAGRLSDRHDPGFLASVGLSVILAGLLIIAIFISRETPLPLVITATCLCGAGFALFSAPNSNAIMSSVPRERLGQASGVIAVTRLTGQITSISVTTLVFTLVIGTGNLTPEMYPKFITAAKILFRIFVPLCVVAIFCSRARGKAEL